MRLECRVDYFKKKLKVTQKLPDWAKEGHITERAFVTTEAEKVKRLKYINSHHLKLNFNYYN